MMKTIKIFILVISLCSGDRPPLLSKNLWQTVGIYFDPKIPKDDKKLSLTKQNLSKISAYEIVKEKIFQENQDNWGFFKQFETGEIIVKNCLGVLPWDKVDEYHENHKEMTPFIHCMDQSFDLNELFAMAIQHPYVFLIESLAECNVDKEAKTKKGWTAVFIAAWLNNAKLLRILIRAGADKNAKNNTGNTALHAAAIMNSAEAAQILIETGANIDAKNKSWCTALDYAEKYKCVEVARILVDAKKDMKSNVFDDDCARILKHPVDESKKHPTLFIFALIFIFFPPIICYLFNIQ